MRLLDFPCGRPAHRPEGPPRPPAETTSAPPPKRETERRRRTSHFAAWQPSLVAIAEDKVFVVTASAAPCPEKAAKGGGGSGKAKAKPAAVRVVRPAFSDDYRYCGVPTVFSSFGSPTFLF